MATAKPGRCAASAFAPGYGSNTTSEPGTRRSPSALSAALNVLEAQAQFDGPERQVSVRVAEHDGLIYLDLADEFWRCIEIGPAGWRIADDVPVRFRRPAACCRCRSRHAAGRSRSSAIVESSASRTTSSLVSWLLGALRAGGPFPLLAISGEQGRPRPCSRKCCGRWIDPSVAPVRALPREDRELFIAAHNGHVLAFDEYGCCADASPPSLYDPAVLHRVFVLR